MNETPAPSDNMSEGELGLLDSLVTSLVEARRGIAAFQALEANLMNAALALALEHVDGRRVDSDLAVREVAAEIGAALRVSDRTVQRQLDLARLLTVDFPATHDALAVGRISRAHVTVITEAGAHLVDPGVRAEFERLVLEVAGRESASRVRPYARLVAERLAPRPIQERHDTAARERGIRVFDHDDGMSELHLTASSVLVHGIHDRVTQIAKAVKDAAGKDAAAGDGQHAGPEHHAASKHPEQRTLDQLRADILCDLALTGLPSGHDGPHTPAELLGAIRAEVHVTVPVLTLAGASGEPAMLDGRQPIDTATAFSLVGASPGWDRALTHPITGAVLAVDRYRPSAELQRFLKAVDERCRFPGCMMPARRCDLDHEIDAALGGPTEEENLSDKCRRHHVVKHKTRWKSQKLPDGTILWTSPTGRQYPDRGIPRVAFVPQTEPPF
ncbi:MAG: DUF222 domain-containing protein [Microbacterium sp.]